MHGLGRVLVSDLQTKPRRSQGRWRWSRRSSVQQHPGRDWPWSSRVEIATEQGLRVDSLGNTSCE